MSIGVALTIYICHFHSNTYHLYYITGIGNSSYEQYMYAEQYVSPRAYQAAEGGKRACNARRQRNPERY